MALRLHLKVSPRRYAEPFVIARGAIYAADGLEVTLVDGAGRIGRGEALPVDYTGESLESMQQSLTELWRAASGDIDRRELLVRMPAGGARAALDAALWDLEAKQGANDPFRANGVEPRPVITAYTIGIREIAQYEAAARVLAGAPWLKVKVNDIDPLAALAAVRRGAPNARLIVDPNQAWSVDRLAALVPHLVPLGVDLLEQPVPVGSEAELDGLESPIPLCADESVDDVDDLDAVQGRFAAVNIKLEKAGGLTAALLLADAARARGFDLMVGCMGGSSLSMAPGMVLAQHCRYVDLDGPRMLAADRSPGFEFRDGCVARPHVPELWG